MPVQQQAQQPMPMQQQAQQPVPMQQQAQQPVPMQQQPMMQPIPPLEQADSVDVGRRLTQWFTIYGFGGVMSSGQVLTGGGVKIARLRQKNTYITIANLRFAASPEAHNDAAYFCLCVQSGLKLTAGAQNEHVFYLGVEAGFGAAGYDVRNAKGKRTHTAMNSFPVSPHLEYNNQFANHAALVVELKILPPLNDGGKTARGGDFSVIVDPPPWVFGGSVGMAF